MTYVEDAETRRPAVGTKVLVFGVAILAVLGSFWGIVWFIRSYVEPPRVMMPSPLALASRESAPVSLPESKGADPVADKSTAASALTAALATPEPPDRASASGGIADRWAPLNQMAPATSTPMTAPAPAPALAAAPAAAPSDAVSGPTMSAATSLATAPDNEAIEEVAEGSVPAISGRAPLPRRKPVMTASTKRNAEPPLPRPRPDGPAPQSVWEAVPVSDDRFPTQ